MIDESLFVSGDLHEREVQIGGKTVKLHFKELPAVEFIRFHGIQSGDDADARAGAAAKLIAASVCNPDGSLAMSYEKALKLKTKPLNAIFAAVLEVNGGGSGKA